MGILIPKVRIVKSLLLESSKYCLKIYGEEKGKDILRMDHYLCINPGTASGEIPGEKTNEPVFGLPALWITEDRKEEAERLGYNVYDLPAVIATHLTEIVENHAAELLDRQITHSILKVLKKDNPVVVKEVLRTLSVAQIQKVLQNLLREKVSIRNMVKILETLADHGKASSDIEFLTEKVRQAFENK
jgi:flagellar biosynthesis protein FlhA